VCLEQLICMKVLTGRPRDAYGARCLIRRHWESLDIRQLASEIERAGDGRPLPITAQTILQELQAGVFQRAETDAVNRGDREGDASHFGLVQERRKATVKPKFHPR